MVGLSLLLSIKLADTNLQKMRENKLRKHFCGLASGVWSNLSIGPKNSKIIYKKKETKHFLIKKH